MSEKPLVSFVVTSYNYARFIGTTLTSILNQTVRDIEVVVVDDVSTDESRQIIESFSDPRVRLHVNDRSRGTAWANNRGLSLAQGEFVAYVDSDDWIDADKTERQLQHFDRNPGVDVIGTYVTACDQDGNCLRSSGGYEEWVNRPHDFNAVETWVGQGALSTSSVMVRASARHRIGLLDATMVRAMDYEYWTRALKLGCRFDMIRIPLVSKRLHGNNASGLDLRGAFLEMTYGLHANIVPLIRDQSSLHLLGKLVDWTMTHEQFAMLPEAHRYRLLALLLGARRHANFGVYEAALVDDRGDPALTSLGKRYHAAFTHQ